MTRRLAVSTIAVLALLAAGGGRVQADWLQPDASYRDAQMQLRYAQRDTAGHSNEVGRLDTLAVALLRIGRTDDAATIFRRVLDQKPGDDAAEGALGKLALFGGRLAEAESLLTQAGDEPEVRHDLFWARLRRGEWASAAEIADEVNEAGRAPMLTKLAEEEPYRISGDPQAKLVWVRAWPVPLLRVRMNGESVLFGIDTGASDLLIDPMWASRAKVQKPGGQSVTFWCGSRFSVENAIVQRLDLGGIHIERIPAGVFSLKKWSIDANPQGEVVAGIIGLNLLRRFSPTIDWRRHVLELRPLASTPQLKGSAARVPFEMWGESEMMVHGTVGGNRRMAMVVQTGVPGCGFAAPSEVFDELGVKTGTMSRLVKGAGAWLQGRPWVGVTVPAIAVGPVVRDRIPGWSDALDSAELWRHGVRRDAILAGGFFENMRLTIDWSRRELAIER